MNFGGGVCSCLPHQSCAFQRWLVSWGCAIRRRPLTRPFFGATKRCRVKRPHNPRSDAIRTCFPSAERVTALIVCLARNVLSRSHIIQRRRNCFRRHLSFSDAPRPDTMEGIFLIGDAMWSILVPMSGPCRPEAGLCVEGQAVEVAQRSVRTNLRGMCD